MELIMVVTIASRQFAASLDVFHLRFAIKRYCGVSVCSENDKLSLDTIFASWDIYWMDRLHSRIE